MMQTVLTKYWLVIHVALILFASWIGLFMPRAASFSSLLWLSLLAGEALCLLPTVRTNENLADARLRVARSVAQDPFFYLGLSVMGIVFIQWLNSGCTLVYLAEADVWQYSLPPVPWAPFSVEAKAASTYVSVFSACVLGGLILRNSVGKEGKRLLLQAAAALSGCLACLLAWLTCRGLGPYSGAAQSSGFCAAGSFFGFWLILGMGGYVDAFARGQRGSGVLFVLAVLGNLLGMLYFSSPSALVLYSGAALLLSVYWLAYLNSAVSKAAQMKLFFVVVAVVASAVVALLFVFPGNPVALKTASFFEFGNYWAALSEMRAIRMTAAFKIWQEHLWVGVGADGFFHFVGTVVEGKEWTLIKHDQAYVYNDCLQFLGEFGVLGASLLGAAVVALIVPICYRARLAWLYGAGSVSAQRIFLLRVSPFVVTGVSATALCFIESWVASPFRSVSLLVSWVFVLATLPSFLPVKSRG
jgi:hypothetical protein